MPSRIIIIGGGLAGLSAAAALTIRGAAVTVLESRPRLGGRAGSFLDHETGEWIDTCQHVGMGCCTNLHHFCRMVGIDDLFREERELTFIGPTGERSRFGENAVPAPFHLSRALIGLRHLTSREKFQLAIDLRELARPRWAGAEDVSFQEWLTSHSRTASVQDRFWDVILVSALSETADRVSVAAARKVFVDGFLANRTGWRVHLPTAPLDEIYGRRLTDWLQSRGSIVRLQAGVEQLEETGDTIAAVRLRSGERIEADEFVLAVPWRRLADLVPASLAHHPSIVKASQLESAPITSVHLWFDRPVLDVPHAVLIGRLSQWVFVRAASGGRRAESGERREEGDVTVRTEHSQQATSISQLSTHNPQRSYLQVVISASRDIFAQPQSQIVAAVVAELADIWPPVKSAALIHSRVVTEHRAVFSPRAGSEALRPVQQSPIGNLQLAGDWTRTGWPATMESAVRSGYLAAENVLRRLGREKSLLQPDLPVSPLARWLFGRHSRPLHRGG